MWYHYVNKYLMPIIYNKESIKDTELFPTRHIKKRDKDGDKTHLFDNSYIF